MKLLSIFFCIFLLNFSYSQSIDFEAEKNIIKTTLSQYLNTNPNSIASFIKGGKSYKLTIFALKRGIDMEEDLVKKEDIKRDFNRLEYYSDSIKNILKTKKISVKISDTLFAYRYTPNTYDLRNETEWEQNYQYLQSDFKDNKLVRLNTIIGEEYIDLIKKQLHYKGADKVFLREELNHLYYQYDKNNLPCKDNLCLKASKLYRAVFNSDNTKGCYLFSFYCRGNNICRSFIFIKKENNKWIYVDEYPSWLVDES